MIRVYDINGRTHYLTANTITRISEAGPNSHGIRCYVYHDACGLIESSDEAYTIKSQVEAELGLKKD